jgi:phage regulator Rha-like protein
MLCCYPDFDITVCDLKLETMGKNAIVAVRKIDSRILSLRGHKVILDRDLAELYGVQVRALNQQVKRNARRFPPAFRFQVSAQELKILKSQNVMSSEGHGGRRYRPYVFTEHGAIMAATVLNSERAIEMSVFVVMAFVRMRRAIASNRQILAKLTEVERRLEGHDSDIQDLMEAIREMISPPESPRRRIGFEAPADSPKPRSKAKS